VYLHNAAEVQMLEVGRDVFMARLQAAFQTLEGTYVVTGVRGLAHSLECLLNPMQGLRLLSVRDSLSAWVAVRARAWLGVSGHSWPGVSLNNA
jgi:hypothetical protein